ncbi:MAG: hypothetical protein QXT53_05010 [Ignisphaera sp.]
MSISKAFSKLVLLVLRSLFLYGFTDARRGSTILHLVFAVLSLYIVVHSPSASIFIFSMLIAFYMVFGIGSSLLYSALVSSIPATWMGLTNLLYTWINRGIISLTPFLDVFIRAEIGSIIVFSLMQNINISELCHLSYRISKTFSLAIGYFWRISSQILKESSEMLYVHGLKGESSWKTLAMLFVRGDEIVDQFTEGVYLKQFSYMPKPIYSRKTVLAQLLMAISVLVIAFLF